MKIIEKINEHVNKLRSYDDLFSKEVDLSKYPEVEDSTCGGELQISEDLFNNDLDEIYLKFKPYFDNVDISNESKIVPVIQSYGNTYICLGFDKQNLGFVYYFDFDFGCFLLDTSLDSFLSKLVDSE